MATHIIYIYTYNIYIYILLTHEMLDDTLTLSKSLTSFSQ